MNVANSRNIRFKPVTKSIQTAAILADVPQPWFDRATQTRDPWLKMFLNARRLADAGGDAAEAERLKEQLIKMVITRDVNLLPLCRRYLTIGDLLAIGRRMIGTGLIGGKSTGMLLARAVMYHNHPKWRSRLEAHDSFYIGSDVFYTYVIQNDGWWARHQMRSSDDLFGEASALREKLLTGLFPADLEDQFRELLNYFGQSPMIVRSSSLLEDAYGNAFSGKYESVFCPN